MDKAELVAAYPVLYHMAEDGTWPSIQRHGLLSTVALVDLFEVAADKRTEILGGVRRRTVRIEHHEHGTADVRDQLPLKFMAEALTEGTTPEQFLHALNNRVFFWLSPTRLDTLLGARQYRNKAQTVLHIDTASFVDAYEQQIQLAPYNTGSILYPNAPKRGADVFVDLVDYPYREWSKKRSKKEAVVELTVPNHVRNIADFVTKVERRVGGQPVETLFERS